MNKLPENTVVVATRKSYGNTLVVYYASKHKIDLYKVVENIPLEVCGFYITTGVNRD